MKVPLYLRVLLILTVIGCGWMFLQDDDLSTEPSPPVATTRPSQAENISATAPANVPQPGHSVDLFPVQTWLPPPPPPAPTPVAVAKVVATPPPMPFTVSAQWRFQNQPKIVVLRGNGSQYTLCTQCSVPGRIRPGGLLGKDYRLDKLTDTSVVLTYLPMKHVSTLRLDAH